MKRAGPALWLCQWPLGLGLKGPNPQGCASRAEPPRTRPRRGSDDATNLAPSTPGLTCAVGPHDESGTFGSHCAACCLGGACGALRVIGPSGLRQDHRSQWAKFLLVIDVCRLGGGPVILLSRPDSAGSPPAARHPRSKQNTSAIPSCTSQ